MVSRLARLSVLAAAAVTSVRAQFPNSANIQVLRAGNGTAFASTAGVPVFVDEYTVAGALVNSWGLPASVTAPQQPCVEALNTQTDGMGGVTADGAYFIFPCAWVAG